MIWKSFINVDGPYATPLKSADCSVHFYNTCHIHSFACIVEVYHRKPDLPRLASSLACSKLQRMHTLHNVLTDHLCDLREFICVKPNSNSCQYLPLTTFSTDMHFLFPFMQVSGNLDMKTRSKLSSCWKEKMNQLDQKKWALKIVLNIFDFIMSVSQCSKFKQIRHFYVALTAREREQ